MVTSMNCQHALIEIRSIDPRNFLIYNFLSKRQRFFGIFEEDTKKCKPSMIKSVSLHLCVHTGEK